MLGRISTMLDDSPIPYQVDLSLFDQIDHAGLREHMEREAGAPEAEYEDHAGEDQQQALMKAG